MTLKWFDSIVDLNMSSTNQSSMSSPMVSQHQQQSSGGSLAQSASTFDNSHVQYDLTKDESYNQFLATASDMTLGIRFDNINRHFEKFKREHTSSPRFAKLEEGTKKAQKIVFFFTFLPNLSIKKVSRIGS